MAPVFQNSKNGDNLDVNIDEHLLYSASEEVRIESRSNSVSGKIKRGKRTNSKSSSKGATTPARINEEQESGDELA